MTRLVLISDTHNQHNKLSIPECDILIHAGDATDRGKEHELHSFFNWMSGLDQAKHKIFVPGNHDFDMQKQFSYYRNMYGKLIMLCDTQVELEGLKIHGTPWTPYFYDWAFNGLEEREEQGMSYEGGPGRGCTPDDKHPLLSKVYGLIPDDTNVVVCHGPPDIGELGTTKEGIRIGSRELKNRIAELKDLLLVHVGHCHEGYGIHNMGDVHIINAATCDRNYYPNNPIVTVDI